MSKELAFDYSEAEAIENPPVLIEEENSEYIQLMKRLQNKTETLSYSSLKAFAKSPRNFIQYKLKPRSPQTESQIFGSLCDAFLTTPEKVDEMFVFIKSFPTSENQIGFCNDMIAGKSKEDAYANNYKTGGVDKVYETLGNYIEAVLSGKLVCTQKMYDEAFKIVENLKKSDLVMQFIDSCNSFQNKREWTYNGWNFKGYTDAEGINLIIDFKFSKDADPDKFERDIVNMDYFMQMGMYSESDGSAPQCYFIVYDKSLNFSVIKLDYSFIHYGIRKYKYLVAKLEDCIKNNRWSESYNFFDVQQRTCYKPKWIKGFETDEFNVE
jgi:hypothetical protein